MNRRESFESIRTLISERDNFLPVVYTASKLTCTRLEFEPDNCVMAQPDQSFWCVSCKARDAMRFVDEENYQFSQNYLFEVESYET